MKDEIRRMIESQCSIHVREWIEHYRGEIADGKILEEDEVERRMKALPQYRI